MARERATYIGMEGSLRTKEAFASILRGDEPGKGAAADGAGGEVASSVIRPSASAMMRPALRRVLSR